jgi:hypothetical protein
VSRSKRLLDFVPRGMTCVVPSGLKSHCMAAIPLFSFFFFFFFHFSTILLFCPSDIFFFIFFILYIYSKAVNPLNGIAPMQYLGIAWDLNPYQATAFTCILLKKKKNTQKRQQNYII